MSRNNETDPSSSRPPLSRRERQIMDAVYHLGGGSAAEIKATIPDPPSYSSVRAQLRILVDKGHLSHFQDGPRYVYRPTVPHLEARESALRHLLSTFFGGSAQEAMVTLLAMDEDLSDAQRRRLEKMIERAQEEGR